MFCHQCGAEIPENTAFCPKCGEKQTFGQQQERTDNAGAATHGAPQNGTFPANENFFAACWRGHKSLAFTFWVMGLVVSTIINFIFGIWLVVNPLLFLISIAYSVFWWVSVWKSAGNYHGPAIWKFLARAAVVLGVIGIISFFFFLILL